MANLRKETISNKRDTCKGVFKRVSYSVLSRILNIVLLEFGTSNCLRSFLMTSWRYWHLREKCPVYDSLFLRSIFPNSNLFLYLSLHDTRYILHDFSMDTSMKKKIGQVRVLLKFKEFRRIPIYKHMIFLTQNKDFA